MLRIVYILLLSLLLISPDAVAQKRTTKGLQKEKQRTQQEINETNKKIKNNNNEITRSLNQLNLIEADIKSHEKVIHGINKELNAFNRRLQSLNDSIEIGEKRVKSLTEGYAHAIRNVQAQSSGYDNLLFIISAESVKQAHRRMRYLQQFAQWRTKQVAEIRLAQDILKKQAIAVNETRKKHADALAKQQKVRQDLEAKRKQQAKVVASLKKEGKNLRAVLAEKQRQAKNLDDALNQLIAEEQRLAAEKARKEAEQKQRDEAIRKQKEMEKQAKARKDSTPSTPAKTTNIETKASAADLTTEFESRKGNIMYPVASQYKIVRPFGRQKHAELKHVVTENNGIDIEVPSGTDARAVMDGKVSAIFPQDGFNTVVMVRHGAYLTIYVNLSEIYVKRGDSVKANQPIGKIFSDPDDNHRTILHFEVRKEREKLNPQEWLTALPF